MGYDPATELIARRNDLVDSVEEMRGTLKKMKRKHRRDTEAELALWTEIEAVLVKVQSLDLKMMPYAYARKSSHTVGDADGNDLLTAFANAVKSNAETLNHADSTRH